MQFGCWVLLFSLFFILLGNYSINLFGWYFLWLLSIIRSYAAKCIWRTDDVDCLNSESWLGLIFKRSIVSWNKCEYLFLRSPSRSRLLSHSDRFRAFDDKSHHCRLHKANKDERWKNSNWIETKWIAMFMSVLLLSAAAANIPIPNHRTKQPH